jgi:nicotinamidase-related amidase
MPKRERAARPVTKLLEAARRNRYKVIHERNLLILALAKHGAGFSAHVVPTADPGTWKHTLCLHTPAGQIHWRLSPEDALDFKGQIPFDRKSDYDGAKSAEKTQRLESLAGSTE